MGKAKAKNNIRILMEDGRYSNFIKGNEYRFMLKNGGVYLIDEDKMGFFTDMKNFEDEFELVENI